MLRGKNALEGLNCFKEVKISCQLLHLINLYCGFKRLLFFGEPLTTALNSWPSLIYALDRVPQFKNLKPSLSNVETCYKIEIEMLLRLIFSKKIWAFLSVQMFSSYLNGEKSVLLIFCVKHTQ
jgi:hypothetical protein